MKFLSLTSSLLLLTSQFNLWEPIHAQKSCSPVTITVTVTQTQPPAIVTPPPDSDSPPNTPLPPSKPEFPAFVAEDVSQWLEKQIPFSLRGVLKNIHPEGTVPGVVIASTSRDDPPYFFPWIRVAALTMDVIVTLYQNATGSDAQKYEQLLWDYASLSRKNQLQQGCSPFKQGECEAYGGPAEPKYEVDGSVYKGPWGRLQTDGPPLRASTLMRFANVYLAKGGDKQKVKNLLYNGRLPADTVVKVDLEFASHHWKDTTFDLWEEVPAAHFFTRMVTRRALLEGAEFAESLGDHGAAKYYHQQASEITKALDHHWDRQSGYIREMIQTPHWYSRQGRNVATILAVLHGYNDDGIYSPINERILATVTALLKDFDADYKINSIRKNNQNLPLGPAVGRYKEDVYDGTQGQVTIGHPWYLATMAIAELYYKIIDEYTKAGSIRVSQVSLPWFKYLGLNNVQTDLAYSAFTPEYNEILTTIGSSAEALVRRVMYHLNGNQYMAEQYRRDNGTPLSAQNLTWSYASVLTAVFARNKVLE